MKKKILNISLIISAIILLIIGISFGISKLVTYDVSIIQANRTSTYLGSTLVSGEQDPYTYNYDILRSSFEGLRTNGYTIIIYGNYEIYCAEPGGAIDTLYDITYSEALALVGKNYTRRTYRYSHAEQPNIGDKTPIQYIVSGESYLPAAAAYIVSDIGGWSIDKQRGLWNLRDYTYYDKNGQEVSANEGLILGSADSQSGRTFNI